MPYQNQTIIRGQQGKWVTISFCMEAHQPFAVDPAFICLNSSENLLLNFFCPNLSLVLLFPCSAYWTKPNTPPNNNSKSHPAGKSKTLMANMEVGGKTTSSSVIVMISLQKQKWDCIHMKNFSKSSPSKGRRNALAWTQLQQQDSFCHSS